MTAKITRTQALEKLREVSEGMRRLNPEAFDAAQASVRRNMQAAIKHQPQLLQGQVRIEKEAREERRLRMAPWKWSGR